MESAILEAMLITAVLVFTPGVLVYMNSELGAMSEKYELISDVQNFYTNLDVDVTVVADAVYVTIDSPEELGVIGIRVYFVNQTYTDISVSGNFYVFDGAVFSDTSTVKQGRWLYKIIVPDLSDVLYVVLFTDNMYKYIVIGIGV